MVRFAPLAVGALTLTLLVSGCSASAPSTERGSVGRPASSSAAASRVASSPATSSTSLRSSSPGVVRGPRATRSKRARPPAPPPAKASSAATATPRATARPTAARPPARPLPLPYPTGDARQAITVVAAGESSTSAVLQRWTRGAGGWRRVGPSVPAEVGADGLSRQPSEARSATPEGSFTVTQAFGRDADPGTALPYRQTTPADWWISEAGPLYNTLQHCTSGCSFTQGDPNEHLYYTTPFYDYAAVIDYNTRNSATGVRPGAGSAFFLHVTVGEPTAGCVAIGRGALLDVLRWLRPDQHPRIVIGVG